MDFGGYFLNLICHCPPFFLLPTYQSFSAEPREKGLDKILNKNVDSLRTQRQDTRTVRFFFWFFSHKLKLWSNNYSPYVCNSTCWEEDTDIESFRPLSCPIYRYVCILKLVVELPFVIFHEQILWPHEHYVIVTYAFILSVPVVRSFACPKV